MSYETSYVVLADFGIGNDEDDAREDDLPAPWVRVDRCVRGDGPMEGRVWIRSVNKSPTCDEVLAELRNHWWDSPEDVTVLVKKQDFAKWRLVVDWRDPFAT